MVDFVHPMRAFRLRQEPPLSQATLAELAETSEATICRIENGQPYVRQPLLKRLMKITGLPAAEICNGVFSEAAE